MARLDLRKIRHVSRLELEDKPITIGRSSSNELVLTDTHVSRHHCVIEHIDGQPQVRDLSSHGGTFVNGKRVEQAPLWHGDRISIGPFDLVFKDPHRIVSSNGELHAEIGHDVDPQAESSGSGTAMSLLSNQSASAEVEELAKQREELLQREHNIARREAELEEHRSLMRKQDAQRIEALQLELESSKQADTTNSARIADLLQQIEAGREQFERINAHMEQLTTTLSQSQQKMQEIEAQHQRSQSQLGRELAEARVEIARLQAHESTLQEQVDALQSARRAALDRAEQAGGALASLRGRVRSLDEAARKIAAVQDRLAEIETAFVEVDEQLENAAENDDEQLERAAIQRQRFSEELEALNQVRDAAVAQLSESAQELREAADRQPLQLTFARPSPVTAGASNSRSARRWWRFGR